MSLCTMNEVKWWSVYVGSTEILCMLPKWRARMTACVLRACGVDASVVQF